MVWFGLVFYVTVSFTVARIEFLENGDFDTVIFLFATQHIEDIQYIFR